MDSFVYDKRVSATDRTQEMNERTSITHRLLHLHGHLPGDRSTRARRSLPEILDVGCGAGAWTTTYAASHAYEQITGLDECQVMIEHANQEARHRRLSRIEHHLVPSLAGPFALPDGSYDLIHMQQPTLSPHAWPALLAECKRVLRPGGRLCLVAWEFPMTNAPSWEELAQLTLKARWLARQSLCPGERHAGLLSELEALCEEAGFHDVVTQTHLLSFSFGKPDYEAWRDSLYTTSAARCLIVQTGTATRQQVDLLCRRQYLESHVPQFRAVLPLVVVWATTGD